MQEAIVNGTPVNPPIWWVDPTNEEAHKINDGKFVKCIIFSRVFQNPRNSTSYVDKQRFNKSRRRGRRNLPIITLLCNWIAEYLLGDSILVAPVIEEDAVTRDVYLPAGMWFDPIQEVINIGPKWLRNYPAPLDVLPHFIRANTNSAE